MTLDLQRLHSLRPDWFAANGALYRYLWEEGDARHLELARLTSARHLRCVPELAIRYTRNGGLLVSEDEVRSLPDYQQSPLFDALDRNVIVFAEQSLIDVHGVDDGLVDALRPAIADEKFYRLALAVGMIECWQRLLLATGVAPEAGSRAVAMLGITALPAQGEKS